MLCKLPARQLAELHPFAEVAYNSSTDFTPFKVATGEDFASIPELLVAITSVTSLKDWVIQLQDIWSVARKSLVEARDAYKKQIDKKKHKA